MCIRDRVSLAHQGVLFLDELPEFRPSVLQGIRQPMESGRVTVTRADGNVSFPARFMLVAAANPCPCGYFGDDEHACTCTPAQVSAYQNRIGGPLMDRIDLHVDVRRSAPRDVLGTGGGTSSEDMQMCIRDRPRPLPRPAAIKIPIDRGRGTCIIGKLCFPGTTYDNRSQPRCPSCWATWPSAFPAASCAPPSA